MVWQIGSNVIFWKQFLGFWISFQLARLERICGLRREVAGSGRPIMLIDGPSFQREDLVLTVGLLPLSIEIKGIPKSVASISDISCFTFFFGKCSCTFSAMNVSQWWGVGAGGEKVSDSGLSIPRLNSQPGLISLQQTCIKSIHSIHLFSLCPLNWKHNLFNDDYPWTQNVTSSIFHLQPEGTEDIVCASKKMLTYKWQRLQRFPHHLSSAFAMHWWR